jgi:Flp pilus assembly protein TadG
MRQLWTRTRERGAAAVEFALLLPLLVAMLMGMIDFGMAVNAQAIIANAAREGARAASFNVDSTATQNVVLSATSTLLGTAPTVAMTCSTMADLSTTINCSSAVAGNVVKVSVTYRYNWISPGILGLPGYTDMTAISQMRIEST